VTSPRQIVQLSYARRNPRHRGMVRSSQALEALVRRDEAPENPDQLPREEDAADAAADSDGDEHSDQEAMEPDLGSSA
jgi:hypothetical protein